MTETANAPETSDEHVSSWVLVDQAMIDAFAEATGDHQFIHVDAEKAAQTPFGGTIAHGFLILSLVPQMSYELAARRAKSDNGGGSKMTVNYGCNKVRFTSPVRSGSRIRLRQLSSRSEERGGGTVQNISSVEMEIEGQDKPAMVAELVSLAFR